MLLHQEEEVTGEKVTRYQNMGHTSLSSWKVSIGKAYLALVCNLLEQVQKECGCQTNNNNNVHVQRTYCVRLTQSPHVVGNSISSSLS